VDDGAWTFLEGQNSGINLEVSEGTRICHRCYVVFVDRNPIIAVRLCPAILKADVDLVFIAIRPDVNSTCPAHADTFLFVELVPAVRVVRIG
jgi:hypothetical protein